MNPQDQQQADSNQSDNDTNTPVNALPPTGVQDVSADTFDKQEFTEVALPAGAEDTDLIEKEWVERAKQIVEHTREDPYEQQRALSQMKADYLKKRYNKDIKVSDD